MMPSLVTEIPAPSAKAADQFARRLSFETDCWDFHEPLKSGSQVFILLDVRGPAAFSHGQVPGAMDVPHGKITERGMGDWPEGTLFVRLLCRAPLQRVGSRCVAAGADRAAVQVMIGGVMGWIDEGFTLASGNSQD